jgi:hypothetical protein
MEQTLDRCRNLNQLQCASAPAESLSLASESHPDETDVQRFYASTATPRWESEKRRNPAHQRQPLCRVPGDSER